MTRVLRPRRTFPCAADIMRKDPSAGALGKRFRPAKPSPRRPKGGIGRRILCMRSQGCDRMMGSGPCDSRRLRLMYAC